MADENLVETPLDEMIIAAESGGRNILNTKYDAAHTAGGFGQITNSTWNDFAPQAGVDVNQYPTAISAPFDDQLRVMHAIQAKRGVQPWAAFNPALANQLKAAGYGTGLWQEPTGPLAEPLPSSLMQPVKPLAEAPSSSPNIVVNMPMSPTNPEPHQNPLALFSILKAMMANTHSFTPVDYDPFKVLGNASRS